uniref:PDZ domain-containing protein n=1 Tax=Trypanosoma congolense (strain IL3000) TaxID=1068625 RepID=G0UWP4_TRYCI|nr:conserved hypothetical protein [Trypanosoma congolense IL3000]
MSGLSSPGVRANRLNTGGGEYEAGRRSGGLRTPASSRKRVHGAEEIELHLSRLSPGAPWGFHVYDYSFPLRVRDVCADLGDMVRPNDVIFEINGVQPGNYAEAMWSLRHKSLTLQLRLHRENSENELAASLTRGAKAMKPESNGVIATGSVSLSPSFSFIPRTVQEGFASPLQQMDSEAPISPAQHRYSGPATRASAQLTLDKVLLAAEGKGSCRVHSTHNDPNTFEQSPTFPSHSSSYAHITGAWQQLLKRRLERVCRNTLDEDNFVGAAAVLPNPPHQAIYDSRNCPFSKEEGFTSEVHNYIQYIMTQRAFSRKRGSSAENCSKDFSSVLTPMLLGNVRSRSDPMPECELQRAHRNGGVPQRSLEDASNQKERLSTQHDNLLQVIATYRKTLSQRHSEEAKRYLKTESSAQEFHANYAKVVSLCGKESAVVGIAASPSETQSGSRREGHKRELKLPSPPPSSLPLPPFPFPRVNAPSDGCAVLAGRNPPNNKARDTATGGVLGMSLPPPSYDVAVASSGGINP